MMGGTMLPMTAAVYTNQAGRSGCVAIKRGMAACSSVTGTMEEKAIAMKSSKVIGGGVWRVPVRQAQGRLPVRRVCKRIFHDQ